MLTNEMIASWAALNNKKYFAIHYIGVDGDVMAKTISLYHLLTLKWKTAGYHYLLNFDGSYEEIEPIWKSVNGMMWDYWGRNWSICKNALQIVFETIDPTPYDGKPHLKFNDKQNEILVDLCNRLIYYIPDIQIGGHKEFPYQNTQCPGYDVEAWLIKNGIPNQNNYYLRNVRK